MDKPPTPQTRQAQVSSFKFQVSGNDLAATTRNSRSETKNRFVISSLADAERYLVGGVNSPVRAFRHVGGEPLVLSRGRGAYVFSDQGERFVDFIMGWGALILGHNHPAITRAMRQAVSRGVLLGLTHPAEIELARLIASVVPSVEQVRFTASGTEACMTAVKLARAHTGRTKVLMFDGCYHGHSETLMVGKSAGIPKVLAQETISVPFNDRQAFEKAMQHHGKEVACVIIEPVAANMGVIVPESGFLARMRELTNRYGVVLIFDEVVTGFRLGCTGAQGAFGTVADLTTFGKIIGGGMPIGAVGGLRRIMQRLAPEGDVYHGGTFAGHPLAMAAGIATLTELAAHPPYERIASLAQQLAEGMIALGRKTGVPVQMNRAGSMVTVFFSTTPVRNDAQVKAASREQFARWAVALRRQGVLVPPSPFEALFLSTAHTASHIEQLLRLSRAIFATWGKGA